MQWITASTGRCSTAGQVTEHAEIVQAIQRRDADAAAGLLDRHMAESVRRLAGGVQRADGAGGLPAGPSQEA
jgi:DNA-binding GntR family transcriptional regulator